MPAAAASLPPGYRLGTIEGFFGRSWSHAARLDHVRFLAAQGCNSHIHAPKSDALLRKRWMELHPGHELAQLSELAALCSSVGLDFGIGLSPYELYRHFDAAHEHLLIAKLEQLNRIGASTLCILFDDMTGDLAGLAERQVAIMDCVRRHSTARRFALCPTYYSSDPRLAALFGSPPAQYLEELGVMLPTDVDIFWTGPKVISTEYPRDHLLEVASQLQRKPLLWDNYPVNDAKRLTDHLHLAPFDRDGATLKELCAGHLANPMNQAALSQISLHTLSRCYQGSSATPETLLQEACAAVLPPAVAAALVADAATFQRQGLAQLDDGQKAQLRQRYTALLPNAAAHEVVDWLEGGYRFDPACLT